MKHKMPKKPTRAQKAIIEAAGYARDNWLVLSADDVSMIIIHKQTGTRREILC